jgi:multidrug transporter EmrE-like cation transporter
MWIYLLFALYIVLSALGLLFIKIGGEDLLISVSSGIFNLQMNIKMLIGMAFYICSFLLFTYIMPKFNLTYIYPIASGILYIIIIITGVVFLREKVTLFQAIGMIIILLGLIVINIKK